MRGKFHCSFVILLALAAAALVFPAGAAANKKQVRKAMDRYQVASVDFHDLTLNPLDQVTTFDVNECFSIQRDTAPADAKELEWQNEMPRYTDGVDAVARIAAFGEKAVEKAKAIGHSRKGLTDRERKLVDHGVPVLVRAAKELLYAERQTEFSYRQMMQRDCAGALATETAATNIWNTAVDEEQAIWHDLTRVFPNDPLDDQMIPVPLVP